MPEPVTLFEFLELLAISTGRRWVRDARSGVAIFVAMTGKGTSGADVSVDATRIAAELDISTRQVWRHVEALVDEGWLEQTQKPTRGVKGKPGRRARYRLTRPGLFTSDESGPSRVPTLPGGTSHEETPNRVPPTADETSHDSDDVDPPETSHDSPDDAESCDVSTPNRVTFSAQSCDIAERENGTVLRTDGSTTDGSTTSPLTSPTQGETARETSLAAARAALHGGGPR